MVRVHESEVRQYIHRQAKRSIFSRIELFLITIKRPPMKKDAPSRY